MTDEISSTDIGYGLPGVSKMSFMRLAVLTLRVVLGWVFFYSGITKLFDPSWTASGYLQHAVPEANPFGGLWPVFATLPLVDVLVQWGLTLTGLGLLLGAFVRWNAFWAAFMMVMFWASSLPLEHAIFVDEHIVYIAVLMGLVAFGAGRIGGLDRYLENTPLVRNNPWLRYLLG
ncbi:DoxX family membrane protein [Halegenticoccus soli]|uniref:DoxX family membrane protein n=1 Tax=Halegenticoccus soli TaxID=1985678 RepID=UPI001E5EC7B4|nr:DoxX family membrane protein [Halegenticoccus soli]